jgi:hypothetical protein
MRIDGVTDVELTWDLAPRAITHVIGLSAAIADYVPVLVGVDHVGVAVVRAVDGADREPTCTDSRCADGSLSE